MSRTDSASRIMDATPEAVYAAMTDPAAMVVWLPPQGMRGQMLEFDLRPGGHYRMVLRYEDSSIAGKTGENSDDVAVRFLDLVPGALVSQAVDFVSDDPAFAGTMVMNWILRPVPEGTEVTIRAENVPSGISAEDHAEGLAASLENLEKFVEG
ncbi:SRPBCC domain-containing protein [Devosia sp.]|uniref:SRPBCC domain-containing protein n=1 Tax=Devosia sp. TaxID=1871048 RepID=UPI0025F12FA0|nr:SRPBCC domain-containing protein [Devosia sp.]MCR6635398.1 SRPBCC domain-containing protein [Devosia sp.]